MALYNALARQQLLRSFPVAGNGGRLHLGDILDPEIYAATTLTYDATAVTADFSDLSKTTKQAMTFGAGNVATFTIKAPSHSPAILQVELTQDGTGSRTITAWAGADSSDTAVNVEWVGDTAPTLSTGAADIDKLTFVWDGTQIKQIRQNLNVGA